MEGLYSALLEAAWWTEAASRGDTTCPHPPALQAPLGRRSSASGCAPSLCAGTQARPAAAATAGATTAAAACRVHGLPACLPAHPPNPSIPPTHPACLQTSSRVGLGGGWRRPTATGCWLVSTPCRSRSTPSTRRCSSGERQMQEPSSAPVWHVAAPAVNERPPCNDGSSGRQLGGGRYIPAAASLPASPTVGDCTDQP